MTSPESVESNSQAAEPLSEASDVALDLPIRSDSCVNGCASTSERVDSVVVIEFSHPILCINVVSFNASEFYLFSSNWHTSDEELNLAISFEAIDWFSFQSI